MVKLTVKSILCLLVFFFVLESDNFLWLMHHFCGTKDQIIGLSKGKLHHKLSFS